MGTSNPYYWLDDHLLLYGNKKSLTIVAFKLPSHTVDAKFTACIEMSCWLNYTCYTLQAQHTGLATSVTPEIETSLGMVLSKQWCIQKKTLRNMPKTTFPKNYRIATNKLKSCSNHIQATQRATVASVRCQKWHLPTGRLQPPRWWKSLHRGMFRPETKSGSNMNLKYVQ